MQQRIKQILREIEQKNNIRILYAVEAGSRAWGYATPDSDYDVKFIYTHNLEWYLSLRDLKDNMEIKDYRESDNLELAGWDLRKTLRLLHSANPALFEWFSSCTIYRDSHFARSLLPILPTYFSVKKCGLHYLHMAKGNYMKYITGKKTVKVKKYLCVLRPALAAAWTADHLAWPPIRLPKLVEDSLSEELKSVVQSLLEARKSNSQADVEHVPELDAFLEQSFANTERILKMLPHQSDVDWEELERRFRCQLFDYAQ